VSGYLPIAEHGLIGDLHSVALVGTDDTNVLITRFLTPDGVGEIEDFMPVGQTRVGGAHRQRVVRRVLAVRGSMGFHTEIAPRFDYGRAQHGGDPAAVRGHGRVLATVAAPVTLHRALA